MPFSKSFPRTIKGSNYPRWEEIFISEQEESEEEQILSSPARELDIFAREEMLKQLRTPGIEAFATSIAEQQKRLAESLTGSSAFEKMREQQEQLAKAIERLKKL